MRKSSHKVDKGYERYVLASSFNLADTSTNSKMVCNFITSVDDKAKDYDNGKIGLVAMKKR